MGLLDQLKRLASPYDDEDYEEFSPQVNDKLHVSQSQQSPVSAFDTGINAIRLLISTRQRSFRLCLSSPSALRTQPR
jgi:hypothetical protein